MKTDPDKIEFYMNHPLVTDTITLLSSYYGTQTNKNNVLLSDEAQQLGDKAREMTKGWDEQAREYTVCAALLLMANDEKRMGKQAMDLSQIRKATTLEVATMVRDYRLKKDIKEVALLHSLLPQKEK